MAINMPHCMFENTDAALQECYERLDGCEDNDLNLSEQETKAAIKMFKRMASMISDYADLMESLSASMVAPKFQKVWCSQCGKEFGPGNSGFSHCENHQ